MHSLKLWEKCPFGNHSHILNCYNHKNERDNQEKERERERCRKLKQTLRNPTFSGGTGDKGSIKEPEKLKTPEESSITKTKELESIKKLSVTAIKLHMAEAEKVLSQN